MTELTATELAEIERERERIRTTYLRARRPASTARGIVR